MHLIGVYEGTGSHALFDEVTIISGSESVVDRNTCNTVDLCCTGQVGSWRWKPDTCASRLFYICKREDGIHLDHSLGPDFSVLRKSMNQSPYLAHVGKQILLRR